MTTNTANTDTAAADAYAASIVAFERAVAESEYNQDTLRAAQECAWHGCPTAPLAIVPPRRIADMMAEDTPHLFSNRATAAGINTGLAYRYAWLVRPAPAYPPPPFYPTGPADWRRWGDGYQARPGRPLSPWQRCPRLPAWLRCRTRRRRQRDPALHAGTPLGPRPWLQAYRFWLWRKPS